MKYSVLAHNIEVSKICFGCEPLGGTDWGDVNIKEIDQAISRSLELGVNFFDTADVYGLGICETRLSSILGARRHDVILATKGGVSWNNNDSGRAVITKDSSPTYLRSAIENSLRRLRVEYLPIYYVHWPDPKTDIRLTFEFLSTLQEEGKIGLLGCSNFNATQLSMASEVADISVLQLPLSTISIPLETDLVSICTKNTIKIIAYNVLANGLLTGKFDESTKFKKNDRRSRLPLFQGREYIRALNRIQDLKNKAHHQNLTLAQYAIKWTLQQTHVAAAITGIKNVTQIEQNVQGL